MSSISDGATKLFLIGMALVLVVIVSIGFGIYGLFS